MFTPLQVIDDGLRALREAAVELGGSCRELQTSPEFRRVLLSRGDESLIVDLVVDRTDQCCPEKPLHGVVRVDPAREILANKLCTLLGRAELRDLVDLRALEESGLSLVDGLAAAEKKDGGLTPGQLAWVLSEIRIGDQARLPGDVAPGSLREYLEQLIDRLARLARP